MAELELEKSVETFDQSEAEENDDVRIIPKLVEQDWMATLTIIFSANRNAEIALNSLKPDIEPRVGCYRELSCDQNQLIGLFSAPDPKGLSISLRGFIDHVVLIESCFKRFTPNASSVQSDTHRCVFRLAPNCEQFSGGNTDFFSNGAFVISKSSSAEASAAIHEYLRVFVENMSCKKSKLDS